MCQSGVKSRGSTSELPLRLHRLNIGEVSGIPSVEVKFVDIRKNTSGEGGSLARYRRSGATAWGANRIRYPGSPRRKRWMLAVGKLAYQWRS